MASPSGTVRNVVFDVAVDLAQKLFDLLAAVIAGNVFVDVPPDPLDVIFVGTVRRQKMELNLSGPLVFG